MTDYKEWEKNYDVGYRNGAADKLLKHPPLQTALHSNLPGYSEGYYDGYHGLQNRVMNEEYIPEQTIEGFDSEEAHELAIYIQSDKEIYVKRLLPIYENLSKKMKNNIYNPKLAVKLFMYMVDDAAKKYASQYSVGDWNNIFSKTIRLEVAEHFEQVFQRKFKEKEYDFMKDGYDMKLKNLISKEVKEDLNAVPVFTSETAKLEAEKLNKNIKAPVVSSNVSTLGGDIHVSILIAISLDTKDTWYNGIYENSRYMRFDFENTGVLEQFRLSHKIETKFRKIRVKSVDDAIAKINKYLDILKSNDIQKEAGNAAAPYSPSVHFMGRGPGRLVWEKK